MNFIETVGGANFEDRTPVNQVVLKRADAAFSQICESSGQKHDIRDLSEPDQALFLARMLKNLTYNFERRKAFESLASEGDGGEWMEPDPAKLSTFLVESLLANKVEIPVEVIGAATRLLYNPHHSVTGALPPVNLITSNFTVSPPDVKSNWLLHRFVLNTFEQPIRCPGQSPESCYAWPIAMDEFARAHGARPGSASDDRVLQLLSSHLEPHVVDSLKTRVRYFRLKESPRSTVERDRLLEQIQEPEVLLTLARTLIGSRDTFPVPLETVAILIKTAVKDIKPDAARNEMASEQLKRLMDRKMLRYGYVPHAVAFLEKWFPDCEELIAHAEKSRCSPTVAYDFYFHGKVPCFPVSANPPLTLPMGERASNTAAAAILSDQAFVREALQDHNKTISLAFLLWRHPELSIDSEPIRRIAAEIKGRSERFLSNLEVAIEGDHRGPSTWR